MAARAITRHTPTAGRAVNFWWAPISTRARPTSSEMEGLAHQGRHGQGGGGVGGDPPSLRPGCRMVEG